MSLTEPSQPTRPVSEVTTLAMDTDEKSKSPSPSVHEPKEPTENTSSIEPSQPHSRDGDTIKAESEEKVEESEATGDLHKAVTADSSKSVEYPTGPKLILVTIALCLSVFCMALVGQ